MFRYFFAAAFALLMPLPAFAFALCSDAGYLQVFGEPVGATACDVRHEFDLTFNGHTQPVRVISTGSHGDDTAWIATMNDALANIALWAEAIGPNLIIQPTKIFLTDHIVEGSDGGLIRGARLGASWAGECDIGMYKLDEDFNPDLFGFTIAHEMFHCIQAATWPELKRAPGAKWWIEGSASYFGSVAYPGVNISGFTDGFAAGIAPHALYDAPLDYETVVFFDRVAELGGPEAVGRLLNALPADGDYLNNLQGQFGLDDWVSFAEAYLLGQVLDAAGSPIAAPTGNPVITLTAGTSANVNLSTDAYRIYRTTIRIPAGSQYDIAVEGSADLRARITLDNASWTDLPQTIKACSADRSVLVYAITTEGPESFHIRATDQGSCSACASVTTTDACLVGDWVMTGGGPIEWMRANHIGRVAHIEASEMAVQFLYDGDYATLPVTATGRSVLAGPEISGQAVTADAGGRWSAGDGLLHICPNAGQTVATMRAGPSSNTMVFGPGAEIQLDYSCSGTTLTTTAHIRRLPPMETTFTKTGP